MDPENSNGKSIALIVGLGNPGPEYVGTYHNIGRRAVEELVRRRGAASFARVSRITAEATRVDAHTFAYPVVYMNESGPAVRALLDFYKLQPEQLLVVHDDADLPLGEVRIAFGRGDAGHHGIQSVIGALGTEAFHRARIGIRTPAPEGAPRLEAGDFVLKHIAPADEPRFIAAFDEIERALFPAS